eukprot:4526113-Amphidinium_carterae.1
MSTSLAALPFYLDSRMLQMSSTLPSLVCQGTLKEHTEGDEPHTHRLQPLCRNLPRQFAEEGERSPGGLSERL